MRGFNIAVFWLGVAAVTHAFAFSNNNCSALAGGFVIASEIDVGDSLAVPPIYVFNGNRFRAPGKAAPSEANTGIETTRVEFRFRHTHNERAGGHFSITATDLSKESIMRRQAEENKPSSALIVTDGDVNSALKALYDISKRPPIENANDARRAIESDPYNLKQRDMQFMQVTEMIRRGCNETLSLHTLLFLHKDGAPIMFYKEPLYIMIEGYMHERVADNSVTFYVCSGLYCYGQVVVSKDNSAILTVNTPRFEAESFYVNFGLNDKQGSLPYQDDAANGGSAEKSLRLPLLTTVTLLSCFVIFNL